MEKYRLILIALIAGLFAIAVFGIFSSKTFVPAKAEPAAEKPQAKIHLPDTDEQANAPEASAPEPEITDPSDRKDPFFISQRLEAPERKRWDYFGRSVAMNGEYIVVAADYAEHLHPEAEDSGAVYVYDNTKDKPVLLQILTASNPAADDRFGNSLAISGSTIVVGTNYKDVDGQKDSGCAYVFERGPDGKWLQTAILENPDPRAGDYFGKSVAVYGSAIVVGAHKKSAGDGTYENGKAYVFQKGPDEQWGLVCELLPSNTQGKMEYGIECAITDGYAFVSAIYADGMTGAVYVYRQTGTNEWEEIQTIRPLDLRLVMFFGYSIAVDDENLIIGTWAGTSEHSLEGAAYIYRLKNGRYVIQQIVTPFGIDDKESRGKFGWAVGISGDYALVTASDSTVYYTDPKKPYDGAAFLYEKSNQEQWHPSGILYPPDLVPKNWEDRKTNRCTYGCSAAIWGNRILIGAYNYDDTALGGEWNSVNSGAAFLFTPK